MFGRGDYGVHISKKSGVTIDVNAYQDNGLRVFIKLHFTFKQLPAGVELGGR
jgi:hypothetical protein